MNLHLETFDDRLCSGGEDVEGMDDIATFHIDKVYVRIWISSILEGYPQAYSFVMVWELLVMKM